MAKHLPRGLSRDQFREWVQQNWTDGLAASSPVDPSRLSAAKRDDHPHLEPAGGYVLHLFDGAWVSLDADGESRIGRVRGLSEGRLVVEIDGQTYLAARRDGVAWPAGVDTMTTPDRRIDVLARPAGADADDERWSIRTAWFEEDL
ncbi:hypothetical protein [Georgenia alba]|uniref:Uncharacterized protein n=1 Tax=Georgenia alba TaxID=2233858 RepID=A0ABW2Q4C6_9MICO